MKYPWFKFLVGDWLKDPALSFCSPASRGIWVDVICRLYELRSGCLTGTYEQLARSLRASATDVETAFNELNNTGTAELRENGNGSVTLVCRRLEREFKKKDGNKLRKQRERGNENVTQSVTPLSRGRSQKSEVRSQNTDIAHTRASDFVLVPEATEKDVDEIYSAYPIKCDRDVARAAIQKTLKEHPAPDVLKSVKLYAEITRRWPKDQQRFIPKPAKWFESKSFLDDPKAWERYCEEDKASTRYAGTKGEFD